MSKEKKKVKQDKKIVSFQVEDQVFSDSRIDRMVKESLIREADEIERELNADPELTGVGVSDDLLQTIVGKLKEQNIWEETAGDEADRKENVRSEGNTDVRSGAAGTAECAHGVEKTDMRDTAVCGQGVDAEISAAPETVQPGTDIEINAVAQEPGEMKNNKSNDAVIMQEKREHTERAEKMENTEKSEKQEDSEKSENPESTGCPAESVQNIQKLYALLPEEDLRALKLGKEREKELQEKEARRRRRRKRLLYGSTVVASIALLFGLGMTSEANRRLVKQAWDVVSMNFNFHVRTNYSGEDTVVRSKTREEVAAMEEICENLGVSAISFENLPGGMEFSNYGIIADAMEAVMFYTYQDTVFSVTIINIDQEGSSYYVMDARAELVETLTTEQKFEAKIWETNQELSEEDRAYIAEIEYNGWRYILNGILSLEEMKKIVKATYIL